MRDEKTTGASPHRSRFCCYNSAPHDWEPDCHPDDMKCSKCQKEIHISELNREELTRLVSGKYDYCYQQKWAKRLRDEKEL